MSNKQSIYIIVAMALLLPGACKKYLDAKPDTGKFVPSTVEDAQLILDNPDLSLVSNPFYGEWSADNYYLPDDVYNNYVLPGSSMESVYTWGNSPFANDLTSDPGFNIWSCIYKGILTANNALEAIKDIHITADNEKQLNNVRGSALVFRSYFFWKLVTTFSKAYNTSTANDDLGIPLRLSIDYNETSIRPTVQATYDQITKDLKAAIPLLPVKAAYITRPSQQAAYGVLSEVYLSMRNYEVARLYADSALQINNLLLNYNTLDTLVDIPMPAYTANPEILWYLMANANNPYAYGPYPSFYEVDTTLYDSYALNDLRRPLFFNQESDNKHYFKGSYAAAVPFSDVSTMSNSPTTAEMYLIRAECWARAGNADSAMQDINTLLQNRYLVNTFTPLAAASPNEALQIVLDHRRKELIFRDLRWIDIKRLNLEGANIVLTRKLNGQAYTLLPNANRYAIPLPPSVIRLSGIQQNPE